MLCLVISEEIENILKIYSEKEDCFENCFQKGLKSENISCEDIFEGNK